MARIDRDTHGCKPGGAAPAGLFDRKQTGARRYLHYRESFNGLELPRENQDPIMLRSQFEAGLSFSTSPDLAIWKVTLPWLAVGYQFGDVTSRSMSSSLSDS